MGHREERSYFSYGQMVYRGQQVHLFGRWHIDHRNAMLWDDYGLEGVLEPARVTGLPVQVSARNSPGGGISAMQMLTALQAAHAGGGILVPWHKQQVERPKTALDLLQRSGRAGLPAAGRPAPRCGRDRLCLHVPEHHGALQHLARDQPCPPGWDRHPSRPG